MTIDLKPEQERILREALRQGRFQSVEEALDRAIHSLAPEATPAKRAKRPPGRKSLAQLFAESPLRGMDLRTDRAKDTGRPLEL